MIGIVTVLYNSAPVLEDFFKTLSKQTYKDFMLYIVDNASKDNSLEETERLSKSVWFKCIMLPQKENGGVARGNNIGIKAALKDGCDYILLSNNDIVLESNTIEELILGHQSNNASMSVPKIFYWNTPNIIWAAGGFWHLNDCTSRHIGYRKPDSPEYNIIKEVEYSPTCFMLINSDVFDRIGLMDEKYFVYYDDADFVWRSVKDGDERLFYIPSSCLWHKEGFSTGGSLSNFTLFYSCRNKIYFSYLHLSQCQRLIMFLYLLTHFVFRDLFVLKFIQINTLLKGYMQGIIMGRKGLNE